MKKTYIIPQAKIRFVESEGLIAASLRMSEGEINNASDVYVKGENSNVSSSNDVWDKVWNREGLSN